MNFGITEILIIAGIILLIFGAGRISKVAGEMGKGIRAFKDGISGKDEEKAELETKPEEKQDEK